MEIYSISLITWHLSFIAILCSYEDTHILSILFTYIYVYKTKKSVIKWESKHFNKLKWVTFTQSIRKALNFTAAGIPIASSL